MEAAVVEMKYDAQKAPLGKLTTEQIKAGYLALMDISNIVNQGSGKKDNKSLLQACNNFYTRYVMRIYFMNYLFSNFELPNSCMI